MKTKEKSDEYVKSSYTPLILTGKLLGLYPFIIDVTGSIKIKVLPAIHSFFIFLFSLYNLFYISLWSDYLSSDSSSITITAKVYLFYKISEAIIFCLSIFNSIFNFKYYVYRFHKVIKINTLFKEIDSTFIDKKFSKSFLKLFRYFYLILFIIFTIDYFVIFYGININITFYSWLLGNIVIVFNFILNFHLTAAFLGYAFSFSKINNELKIIGEKRIIKKEINLKYNSNNRIENDYIYVTSRKIFFIIMFAFDEYIILTENYIAQNSLIMLLMVVTCIIGVTSNLYIISSMFLSVINNEKQSINWYILIHSLYWCFIMWGRILHFVSAINSVAKQVRVASFYYLYVILRLFFT